MTTHPSGTGTYVLFKLAGATYALPSDDIQQLEMVSEPTPVPNAPPFVEGVVSVRGQVIPAMSLRMRFGFPKTPHDMRSRLVIVRARGRTVGLVVDSASEFASIPAEEIQPPPDEVTGLSGRYLRGLAHRGGQLVLVLDAGELLAPETTPTSAATDAAVTSA